MSTINTIETGANIKRMIKERGLKIKDIQAEMGFGTPQAIYKWFNGVTMPTLDNIVILAGIFNVAIDDIVVTEKIM